MPINNFKSELDNVKTTITLSMGTKNRLRSIKGNMGYEDFINYLINMKNGFFHSKMPNAIELIKFERDESTFSEENHKIIFSYNKFIYSNSFRFDIKIESAICGGKRIPCKNFFENNKSCKKGSKIMVYEKKNDYLSIDANIYFKILSQAIRQEILSTFKHNGTFKDYFSWKNEFKMLGLPNSAFEEDVMEKLESFHGGY